MANCAVGFDNIDLQACTRHGVPACNTPGVLTETTADATFALTMTAARWSSKAAVPPLRHPVDVGPLMMLGQDIHHITLVSARQYACEHSGECFGNGFGRCLGLAHLLGRERVAARPEDLNHEHPGGALGGAGGDRLSALTAAHAAEAIVNAPSPAWLRPPPCSAPRSGLACSDLS